MLRPKKHSALNDDQPWLISYSDMVTIILTFFVFLVAISQIDNPKYNLFRELVSLEMNKVPREEKVNNPVVQEMENRDRLKNNILRFIDQEKLHDCMMLEENSVDLKLIFPSQVFFDSGKADLKKEFEQILKEFMRVLHDSDYKDYSISVLGHSDDVPICNSLYPSNWELSAARSARVANFLISQGLVKNRVQVSGFADTRPSDPILDSDPPERITEKQAKNRRIEIQINYYQNKL